MGNQKTNQGFSKKVIVPFDAGVDGNSNNLYFDVATGEMYYWNGTEYVSMGGGEFTETNTTITTTTDGFQYTNELGAVVKVTQKIDSTDPNNQKIQTFVDGVKVFEFPLYTVNNDIQIDNSGSEWDLTDDQITIKETNGDTQVINFPYRVTVVVNPDGSIAIKQNGVDVGTIPAQVVTTISNVVSGHKIATYTNESGVTVDINETVTSFGTPTYDSATGVLSFTFVDENGTTNTKTVTLPSVAFKELKQFHVDPNGNDTTGLGADEKPYQTITKALSVATQATAVVVNEGSYNEVVTISTQNLVLRGEGIAYGTLTELMKGVFVTANGTSVSIEHVTTSTVDHSGTSPLYLRSSTLNSNFTSTTTAYTEIKDCRIQTGTISKTAAGILLIHGDSFIGDANFATPNSIISLRNVVIDAGKAVTIGAGVIYSLQDVVGVVNINAGAIPLKDALLAQGATALQAKLQECSTFNDIRLTNVETITTATKMLVRDADGIVREQVFSSGLPSGGTDGQVLTVQPDGSYAWESLPTSTAPLHEREVFNSTDGQTTFTLSATPIGGTEKVHVTRNGIDISDAFTWVNGVGTYDPAENYGCVLDANDELIFHYEKENGSSSSSVASTKSVVKARWSAITSLAANTTIPVANLTQTQINTTPSQWNATTGVYTAPAAGIYMVSANVSANATLATGSYFTIDVLKNGVSENTFVEQSIGGGGTVYITAGGAVPMLLAAGDTVSFTILANVASQTHIMGTNFSVTQL